MKHQHLQLLLTASLPAILWLGACGEPEAFDCEEAAAVLQNCQEDPDPEICSDDGPAALAFSEGQCASSEKADQFGFSGRSVGEDCSFHWQCDQSAGLSCGSGVCEGADLWDVIVVRASFSTSNRLKFQGGQWDSIASSANTPEPVVSVVAGESAMVGRTPMPTAMTLAGGHFFVDFNEVVLTNVDGNDLAQLSFAILDDDTSPGNEDVMHRIDGQTGPTPGDDFIAGTDVLTDPPLLNYGEERTLNLNSTGNSRYDAEIVYRLVVSSSR